MRLSELKTLRERQGLSQSELSVRSGVSLATVQGIERGAGNPAFGTLSKLLEVLGHRLIAEPSPVDWDQLVCCGLPLGGQSRIRPNLALLVRWLPLACSELVREPDHRKQVAVEALLLALRSHYPTTFRTFFDRGVTQRFAAATATGKHVKLARAARSVLGGYL